MNSNYADEFDVYGFKVMKEDEYNVGIQKARNFLDHYFRFPLIPLTEKELEKTRNRPYIVTGDKFAYITYEEYLADIPKWNKKVYSDKVFELYFGTNEQLQWYSTEDFLSSLKTKEITEEEAKIIEKLFGKEYGFTYFPLDESYYEEEL